MSLSNKRTASFFLIYRHLALNMSSSNKNGHSSAANCTLLANQSLSFWSKINKTQKNSDSCGYDLPLQSAAPGIGYQPEKFSLGHHDMVIS
jgi:hypothetical protein